MDAVEFKEALDYVRSEFSLITGYRIAFYGTWPTAERVGTINRHRGIFIPVREALRQTMLMTMARLIDTDTRVAGIPNIVGAIRNNPTLLPNADHDLLNKLENDVISMRPTVEKLITYRIKRLAHHDRRMAESSSIHKQEMDELFEVAKQMYNHLSSTLDRSVTSWHMVESDAERHTKQLLDFLELGVQCDKERLDRQLRELSGESDEVQK